MVHGLMHRLVHVHTVVLHARAVRTLRDVTHTLRDLTRGCTVAEMTGQMLLLPLLRRCWIWAVTGRRLKLDCIVCWLRLRYAVCRDLCAAVN